jgi:3',5'-cyclic AMP phosphodiesterase CpdA
MTLCYKIASEITKGEYPCIVSRGNHDLRGYRAEELANYMPGDNGKSYYTFKVGCIWGILVDTGEDKDESLPVYGGTVCCHQFRLEQSEMIEKVIENADAEYGADDVKFKLVISHVPFTFKRKGDFDIEREIYSDWAKLIKNNIKPDLMLCGHTHTAGIYEEGNECDDLGQPCTIIVGSAFKDNDKSDADNVLAGAYIKLSNDCAEVKFNTKKGILGEGKVIL